MYSIDLSGSTTLIRNLWKGSVQAVIEIGRELAMKKELLDEGRFTAWVEADLPFSPRTAQRLMAVAANSVLTDPTHVSRLPAFWGTLYELSRLPEEVLSKALEDGKVTAKTERKDVAALRPEKEHKKRSLRQEQKDAERILLVALAALTKLVGANVRHLDPKRLAGWADELRSAMAGVERLCDTLRDLIPADVEVPMPVPSEELAL